MLAAVSEHLAQKLGEKLEADSEQVAIYTYGLELLLCELIKTIVILLIAILLDCLNCIIVFMIFFIIFRSYGGGAHLNSYLRCLVFGILLVIGVKIISGFQINVESMLTLYIITLGIIVYQTIAIVPKGTAKQEITEPFMRVRRKRKMAVAILIWSIVVILFMYNNQQNYAFSLILASLYSSFLMTPSGYALLRTIDRISEREEGEYV